MTRAPTDRSHLSIGEVLSLLQEEFPDVTISKIRFLESQGLLDPERTPSGYRKFYEGDIDRLRWILRQQKDHYLPLKVIKDRLDDAVPRSSVPAAGAAGGAAREADAALGNGDAGTAPRTAVALDERPGGGTTGTTGPAVAPQSLVDGPTPAARPSAEAARPRPTSPTSSHAAPDTSRRFDTAGASGATRASATAHAGAVSQAPETGSVSLTAEELAQHSGLMLRDLRDLERYGLVEGFEVGDATYYDADALVVAQTAAGFLQHGIEARHMRTYKVAIDREAGLFEQIVLPLLKQRNPEARQRARETVTELIRLGQQMRGVLLHQALRDHVQPS